MSVVPCKQNQALAKEIDAFAETLRQNAHSLGEHGLSEAEFYNSGILRGAVEKLRGQFISNQSLTRDFVKRILNHMELNKYISEWEPAESTNRYDYSVTMPNGIVTVISITGCMDGQNTNLNQRPAHADEFIIWSICESPAANLGVNVWSGIHSRISADIISRQQVVDGLVVWGMMCGSATRPCPKIITDSARITEVGQYKLPPPCIYLMPSTAPRLPGNEKPKAQSINEVEFLKALRDTFKVNNDELFSVDYEIMEHGPRKARRTTLRRDGVDIRRSKISPIRRA